MIDFNRLNVTLAGRLIYYLFPYRRRIILKNIDQVFGKSLSSENKITLIKAIYSHVATSLKEILLLGFMSEQQLQAMVDVRGIEHLNIATAKKMGVLILTGHFGNWELTPIGGILNFKEFKGKFHFIRRTLVNKRVEQLVFKRYYKSGLDVIPQRNSLHEVCRVLEKNHAVVFVMDQHASLTNRDGIAVEFFGKKAGTYRSLASIACYKQIAVVPAGSYRLPNGRHVLEFYEPILPQIYPNSRETLYHNTLAYNQALEAIILAHPEQWIWFHKRWKDIAS